MYSTNSKILGSILFLFLISCGARLSINTLNNIKHYEKYKTYAYLPNTDFDISSPISSNNGPIAQKVIEAVNRNMQRAGYILDRKNPDLLVVLNAQHDSNQQLGVEMVPANPEKPEGADPSSAYYDPYYYWKYAEFNDMLGYKILKNKDKRAGLAIEIIDRKEEKVIWHATAKEPLGDKEYSTALDAYVDTVFEEFPTMEDR